MKYNIEKMQQGGGFATFTPIVESMPSQGVSAKGKAAAEPEAKSILDDETFKKMLTTGLVNDTNSLISELVKMESSTQNPYIQSSNKVMALRLIGKANELKQSGEMWKSAMATSKANGSLGEVAVGGYGEVYAKDKDNKVVAMSLSDYKSSDEKPKLLTVAELLNERQYNPNLTGRNDLFNAANNSIGLNKITDHVKGLVHALGRDIYDTDHTYSKDEAKAQATTIASQFGAKSPTQDDLKSLSVLKQVVDGTTDYAKVEEKGSSQRKHVDQALDYIWGTLGTNAQQKLTATAVMNGSNDPRKFLMEMLYTETGESYSSKVTPVKTPGESALGGHEKAVSAFELFNNGKTGKQSIQWNEPGTGKTMNLVATGVARLSTSKGETFGMATLGKVLGTEQGALVHTDGAFFGDKHISQDDMNKIIYDGQDAARVYMPTTASGAPDYTRLDDIKQLEHEAFSHHDWDKNKINEFFAQRGYGYVQVNDQKEYVMNNRYKPFLLMYGLTTDGAQASQDNSRIHALSGGEEAGVKNSLLETWKKEKISAPTGFLYTTYYKGAVAIPYRDDSSMYAAALHKNLLAPQTSIEQARVNQNIQQGTIINPNSQFLFTK